MPSQILKKVGYLRVDGGCLKASERIVRETALEIRLDGEHFATAMLLAALEREFVLGHLFTQGIISNAADVRSISIENHIADVVLRQKKKPETAGEVRSDLRVSPALIFECVRTILKSEVFTETEAVHSAGLFLEGREAVSIAEDLGRHHALDKVIGGGLLRGVDFSRTLAASTGRQPTEMIIKCRHAGIPIIATKGVPTALAVTLAKESGITIAGLVRGDTMNIYSHPERVEGAGG
jgi:FdhD protein